MHLRPSRSAFDCRPWIWSKIQRLECLRLSPVEGFSATVSPRFRRNWRAFWRGAQRSFGSLARAAYRCSCDAATGTIWGFRPQSESFGVDGGAASGKERVRFPSPNTPCQGVPLQASISGTLKQRGGALSLVARANQEPSVKNRRHYAIANNPINRLRRSGGRECPWQQRQLHSRNLGYGDDGRRWRHGLWGA